MTHSKHKIFKSVICIRNALHYSDQSGCKLEFVKRYEYNNHNLSISFATYIGHWYVINMTELEKSLLLFEIDHEDILVSRKNNLYKRFGLGEDTIKDVVDMDDLSIALTYRKGLTDDMLLDHTLKGAEDLFLDFAKSKVFRV